MAYRRLTQKQTLLQHGVRSGLEEAISKQLATTGVRWAYEAAALPYIYPAESKRYTPDYFLLDNGIVVESKGRFMTADRKRHKLIKAQYPDLDIRFVFSCSRSKIGKKSKTTYGMWATQHGFKYADKLIPDEWLKEPVNKKSLAIIERLLKEQE